MPGVLESATSLVSVYPVFITVQIMSVTFRYFIITFYARREGGIRLETKLITLKGLH